MFVKHRPTYMSIRHTESIQAAGYKLTAFVNAAI